MPPTPEPFVSLVTEDASCTEVWLRLSVKNVIDPRVALKRNDSLLSTYILTTPDTTIIDENLLPNRTYTYTAQLLNYSTTLNSTTQARTMDTTSHDFTFQTFTLGDGSGSSCLYDVAIINDTLAYAVGELYRNDTTFNVAKWNGQNWELMRLLFTCRLWWPNCWPPDTDAYSPGYSVFAFSPSDIWIAAGAIFHFNGTIWEMHAGILGAGNANKIWGSSSSDLYFVGNNGLIAHYNGSSWSRIESPAGAGGTTLDITDIWGSKKTTTGETEILAVANKLFTNSERSIMKVTERKVTTLSDVPISWSLYSVWFASNRHYYVAGSGIYEKRKLSEKSWLNEPLTITPYYTYRIRGSGINNVFAVGGYGDMMHYNGVSWKSFYYETAINGNYYSLAVNRQYIIAVGSKAQIAIGRRVN